ncbi:hypothetical protein [Streptomyces sp. NPDC093984]|uniref:helix-turn-helix domain-containing protein n=1 Tax=Streptomyces sp. NPDC093984 TaxID=3366052 RepID=UPI003828688F
MPHVQFALSGQVDRLEKELGARLFDRISPARRFCQPPTRQWKRPSSPRPGGAERLPGERRGHRHVRQHLLPRDRRHAGHRGRGRALLASAWRTNAPTASPPPP